ncbi:hypothetical protein K435DRAFT_585370, partial [Dendrothele bispora CBS 962.96]
QQWIGTVGRHRFCGSCSDSTGNTLLARALIHQEVNTILPFADICHHLDNTNKDIIKLEFFHETRTHTHHTYTRNPYKPAIPVLFSICGTIRCFSQSHLGKSELKIARREQLTGAGLEAIGKTRFVTVVLSAMSIQRTLPAIKQVVSEGKFTFEFADYFQEPATPEGFEFDWKLRQLIQICSPIAKALVCLEANDTNPADAFIFWHAVIFDIERTLTNSKNRFPENVRHQILSILNHRHKQLFQSTGKMYNAAYLSCTVLNPSYYRSDLLRDHVVDPKKPLDEARLNQLK